MCAFGEGESDESIVCALLPIVIVLVIVMVNNDNYRMDWLV